MTTIYQQLGAEPRIEVGAVLRVGMRDEKSGVPIDKDSFTVADPVAADHDFTSSKGHKFKAPGRRRHPDFGTFNALGKARRTSFRGTFVYADQEDCFIIERRAARLPGFPEDPNYRPACSSVDGLTATRLYRLGDKGKDAPKAATLEQRGDQTWGVIPCPGEKCEFALGDDPPCKRRGWLYFMPRWEDPDLRDLPVVLMRYYTGSPASVAMILGGFEQARKMADAAGFEIDNWSGFPFVLQVSEATSRGKGRRFPLVRMVPDGELLSWLAHRRQQFALAGLEDVKLLPAARDTETDRDLDPVTVEPPRVPGQGGLFEEGK